MTLTEGRTTPDRGHPVRSGYALASLSESFQADLETAEALRAGCPRSDPGRAPLALAQPSRQGPLRVLANNAVGLGGTANLAVLGGNLPPS